jgi:hypothetical protein
MNSQSIVKRARTHYTPKENSTKEKYHDIYCYNENKAIIQSQSPFWINGYWSLKKSVGEELKKLGLNEGILEIYENNKKMPLIKMNIEGGTHYLQAKPYSTYQLELKIPKIDLKERILSNKIITPRWGVSNDNSETWGEFKESEQGEKIFEISQTKTYSPKDVELLQYLFKHTNGDFGISSSIRHFHHFAHQKEDSLIAA